MSVIEDAEGTAYFEEEQIANQISAYFSNKFSSDSTTNTAETTRAIVDSAINPSVPDLDNEHLTSIPEAAEIRNAMFLIYPDKAPDPDGFSANFFHSNWSSVGSALISEIQTFFGQDVYHLPPTSPMSD